MNKEIMRPARFRELSLLQRGTTLLTLGLASIASACGNKPTGGESTTTSSTVAESITSTTQPPTSTTEATTSITEAPSTTTTIPITEPTGEVYNEGYPILKLGIIEAKDFGTSYEYYVMTGRITGLEIETIQDFQGKEDQVYVLILVLGKYDDGSPYEKKFMLGRDINDLFTEVHYPINDFNYSGRPDIVAGLTDESILELESLIMTNAQIGIHIPYRLENDYLIGCSPESVCESAKEGREYIPYNIKVYNDLLNQTANGVVKNDDQNNLEFGWVDEIIIFPS